MNFLVGRFAAYISTETAKSRINHFIHSLILYEVYLIRDVFAMLLIQLRRYGEVNKRQQIQT